MGGKVRLKGLDEYFEVALHPEIQHALDGLGPLAHDLQELAVFLTHHFLQLYAVVTTPAELLGDSFDVGNGIINILCNI